MASFFQRMTSLVSRNSNKFLEESIDEDEAENERQRHFNQLKQRRRSAPDIRRRDRLIHIPDTSDENLSAHFSTSILPRKHYNSTGKLIEKKGGLFFF
jgi:hypothetical protein